MNSIPVTDFNPSYALHTFFRVKLCRLRHRHNDRALNWPPVTSSMYETASRRYAPGWRNMYSINTNASSLVITDMTFGLPIREGRTFPYRRKRRKMLPTVFFVTPSNSPVSWMVFRAPQTSQIIRQRKSSLTGAGMFCLQRETKMFFYFSIDTVYFSKANLHIVFSPACSFFFFLLSVRC